MLRQLLSGWQVMVQVLARHRGNRAEGGRDCEYRSKFNIPQWICSNVYHSDINSLEFQHVIKGSKMDQSPAFTLTSVQVHLGQPEVT